MNARQVIQRAAQLGWELRVEGGRIVAEPLPTCSSDMPTELAARIKEHMAAGVAILLSLAESTRFRYRANQLS